MPPNPAPPTTMSWGPPFHGFVVWAVARHSFVQMVVDMQDLEAKAGASAATLVQDLTRVWSGMANYDKLERAISAP